jgi:hypothetical protein
MKTATVKQLAAEMRLSESRIRALLGKKGAPKPTIEAVPIYGGKIAGRYDLQEFKEFYAATRYKRPTETEKILGY